jgi:hypothetical protein
MDPPTKNYTFTRVLHCLHHSLACLIKGAQCACLPDTTKALLFSLLFDMAPRSFAQLALVAVQIFRILLDISH